MKKAILYIIVGAIAPTVFIGSEFMDAQHENKIQQIEILNLRGYKFAYLEHMPLCDTLHRDCFRSGAGTMTVGSTRTLSCKDCSTETVICNSCNNSTICNTN